MKHKHANEVIIPFEESESQANSAKWNESSIGEEYIDNSSFKTEKVPKKREKGNLQKKSS